MTLEELTEYGMARMDEAAIDGFLSSHSIGVLGLPAEDAPYLLPLSYSYDGESLYFLYVVGAESRKADLSDRAEAARFLVYSAETVFNWRSVLLSGTIEEVPVGEWDPLLDEMEMAWRPELFETASEMEVTRLYRFRIEERSGIKHTGLPPALEARSGGDRED